MGLRSNDPLNRAPSTEERKELVVESTVSIDVGSDCFRRGDGGRISGYGEEGQDGTSPAVNIVE